jgi:hypothetical protein
VKTGLTAQLDHRDRSGPNELLGASQGNAKPVSELLKREKGLQADEQAKP